MSVKIPLQFLPKDVDPKLKEHFYFLVRTKEMIPTVYLVYGEDVDLTYNGMRIGQYAVDLDHLSQPITKKPKVRLYF